MKKQIKKISFLLMIIFMFLSINLAVFAKENEQTVVITDNEYKAYNQIAGSDTHIANIISITAVDVDKDHVKLSITNIGIDTFDKVSCYVEVWDTAGVRQYAKTITETDIFPLFPRNTTIYVKNWSKISVTNGQGWDGSDYGTFVPYELER